MSTTFKKYSSAALKVVDRKLRNLLRPHQYKTIKAVLRARERSICIVEQTGAGKTHEAMVLAKALAEVGAKVVFLARLDLLLSDVYERFTRAGIRTGIIQASRPEDPDARVQVVSIQTILMRGNLPEADFVFIDECHCAPARSVKALLGLYENAKIIGLTATLWRMDNADFRGLFDRMIVGRSVKQLIKEGVLVPCEVRTPHPDDATMKGLIGHPIAAYKHWTPDTLAVVFAENVAHAKQVVADANAIGISAELMVGSTARRTRKQILARFYARRTLLLVGVGVFKEGFDAPPIETVILGRKFKSMTEYLQACGRGMRAFSGKPRCTILDLYGSTKVCGGPPDHPRSWTLDGSGAVQDSTHADAKVCEECGRDFRGADCPRCNAANPEPGDVIVTAAIKRMILWSSAKSNYLDKVTFEELIKYAKRCHKAKPREWAIAQFKRGVGSSVPAWVLKKVR